MSDFPGGPETAAPGIAQRKSGLRSAFSLGAMFLRFLLRRAIRRRGGESRPVLCEPG